MKHHHGYAVGALSALTGMLLVSSALAADADATGLVPTIWLDFENQSASASSFKSENKGSASVSFTGDGKYKAGANNGYALDTTRCTPYTNQGTFSTAGQDFTVSAVMTLGTNPTGITLSLRSNAGDLVIRRGTDSGSIVLAFGPEQTNATSFLNAAISGGDAAYHLVSLVFRSSGTELYVDGVSKGSTTDFTLWHGSSALSRLQFGTHLGGIKAGEVAYGGYVDDFRVHDAALTTAQMKVIAFEYGLIEFADSLQVKGSPANWGTVDPAYGVVANISQGQSFTCSASGSETATTKIIPIGYSLFSVASGGNSTLKTTGNTSSFSYTHGTTADRLVWNWAQSNLVTVAAGEGGTTTGSGWAGYEGTFDVTATPYGGYKFLYWTGDTTGIDVLSPSIAVPAVTKPLSLAAKFIGENIDETTQWVSPDGDDANDGYSESSPKKTISSAVGVLNPVASAKTCVVHVAPGLYEISKPIAISGAIRIIGEGDTPSDVVVTNVEKNTSYGRNARLFTVTNPGAWISGLTMVNGYLDIADSGYGGGGIYLGAGTVSNCVVLSSAARQSSSSTAKGGGVHVGGVDALLTHCIISKCRARESDAGWAAVGAAGVYVDSGRIENCLVLDCRDANDSPALEKLTGGILLKNASASAVNCTVIGCVGCRAGGIFVENASATVKNCVAFDCKKRLKVDDEIVVSPSPFAGTVAAFDHCASDATETYNQNETILGLTSAAFKDYVNGDYRPKAPGPLVNKCVSYVGMPAIDLGGNKRLIGSKIDIGCYEANAAEFRIHLR